MYNGHCSVFTVHVLTMKGTLLKISCPLNVLSMECSVHKISCSWNVLSMECLVLRMSCPRNVISMEWSEHDMSCPWNVLSIECQFSGKDVLSVNYVCVDFPVHGKIVLLCVNGLTVLAANGQWGHICEDGILVMKRPASRSSLFKCCRFMAYLI